MRINEKRLPWYPWYLRLFLSNQKRKYGEVLTPALLWGRMPKLFRAVALLYGVLDRRVSPLNPVLRSMVNVRVSRSICAAVAVISTRRLSQDDRVRWSRSKRSNIGGMATSLMRANKPRWSMRRRMTDLNQRVTDQTVRGLREHFDEDAIVELTGLIRFQTLSSKFNSALDVPAEGFCSVPP